jgi:hypothetical protein
VKTYNQNTKYIPQDSLYPVQTRNPGALNQCQSIDSSYHAISGFKLVTLVTALALGLIAKPYIAHAEENAVTSNLQALAVSYSQESNNVLAQDHWTRIEFSGTYVDPVVVVEGSSANENNSYVVGIRNVDEMGFEISLKNCNKSTGNPVQEDVNYAVIERNQLPATEDAKAEFRQQFSWGECTTAAANATTS